MLKKPAAAPTFGAGKPPKKFALPNRVFILGQSRRFSLSLRRGMEPILMQPQPCQNPVEAIARIGHKNAGNALSKQQKIMVAAVFKAVLQAGRPSANRFPQASRSRSTEFTPDHPARLVADHIGQRLAREEPKPLRKKHKTHGRADGFLFGNGSHQIRLYSLARNNDRNTVEDAGKAFVGSERFSLRTQTKRINIVEKHCAQHFIAVGVDGVDHGRQAPTAFNVLFEKMSAEAIHSKMPSADGKVC